MGVEFGGRKILWAREKSGKRLKIRQIKIQKRILEQCIEMRWILDTISCTIKEKRTRYSKVIHRVADVKYV